METGREDRRSSSLYMNRCLVTMSPCDLWPGHWGSFRSWVPVRERQQPPVPLYGASSCWPVFPLETSRDLRCGLLCPSWNVWVGLAVKHVADVLTANTSVRWGGRRPIAATVISRNLGQPVDFISKHPGTESMSVVHGITRGGSQGNSVGTHHRKGSILF